MDPKLELQWFVSFISNLLHTEELFWCFKIPYVKAEQHTCRQGRMASSHFLRLPTHRDGSTGSIYKTDFCKSCATFPLYQLWLEISKALKETAIVFNYTKSGHVKCTALKDRILSFGVFFIICYTLVLVCFEESQEQVNLVIKQKQLNELTVVQLTENSVGLMNFNWYIILHTTITQAQTEDAVEANGRSLAYGTANVHDARNTKFIRDTYKAKRETQLLLGIG